MIFRSRNVSLFLFVVFSFVAKSQQFSDPFYKYGFPEAQIYIDLSKALKEAKEVTKLKLEEIDLSLEQKSLTKFNSLNVLAFQNNKLDSFPLGLFDNPSLNYFSCAANPIVKFPEEMGYWTRLRELKLFNTKLDSFPSSFVNLTSIERIEIQSNLADTFFVNKSFSKLENLNELLIYKVILSEFPIGLGASKKLSNLYLIHTQFNELDSSLYDCKNLKTLVLEGNNLSKIDKEILNLNQLEVLSFKNNQLKSVPEFISKFQKLKTLDLIGNPIPKYQVEILRILMPDCNILF